MTLSLDSLRAKATLQEWKFPSQFPIVGPLIAALRRAVFSLASRWALLAIAQQQTTFNNNMVDTVEALGKRVQNYERLWMDTEKTILEMRRELAEISLVTRHDNDSIRQKLDTLTVRLDELFAATFQTSSESAATSAWVTQTNVFLDRTRDQVSVLERDFAEVISVLVSLCQERRDVHAHLNPSRPNVDEIQPDQKKQLHTTNDEGKLDYFLFEMRYRGSTKEISGRHTKYLEYFQTSQTVLDLGCGRGEFLELLIQNRIPARGVDLDPDMVDYCQQRGLPVALDNAITFLEGFEDSSLGGIFMGQVVEHLPPDTLINLIQIAHRKLVPDACFVAETINPMCLLALTTHYLMDWSHVHPVHPETLRFVLQSVGFDNPTVLFSEPVPDAVRLKRLPDADELSMTQREWLAVQNDNVDRLNNFLFGNQDYAIVARKLAWPRRLADVASRRMLLVEK